MTTFDLLVAGRPSVDVLFGGLERWPALGDDIDAATIGVCAGTSFNTPAAANRIGLRVAYIAQTGNDVWSDLIAAEFEAEGLSTAFLEVEDRALPAVSVALNFDGDRGFVSHWDGGAAVGDRLDARALEITSTIDARHLHAQLDDTPALEALAKERGMTVSLDSFDGASWASERPLAESLRWADVLLANEAEAGAMTGSPDLDRALETLAVHCPCVVIRRGADGAIAIAGGEVSSVPAEAVEVVDTTGAGDCFNAGFLAGWIAGLPLRHSLTLGVLCGTGAVTDFGGYRGCPRESALRAAAALHGVELPTPLTRSAP
jgi:sugar/nucleoside kinase (ribokinase family)